MYAAKAVMEDILSKRIGIFLLKSQRSVAYEEIVPIIPIIMWADSNIDKVCVI